jgi:type IV fimbrial biogenesis protein FimT
MLTKGVRIGRRECAAKQGGFTLIELLVTLIVLAVVVAIAVPNLTVFVNSSRLRASQSELVSALSLARSEATKRGVSVGVQAVAAAAPGGQEFNQGWRVFVDEDGNGAFTPGPPAELVVREFPAVSDDFRFGTTGGERKAIFNSRGFLTSGEVVFNVCGKAGVTKGYRIRLEQVGIADVVEGESCT